MRQLQLFKGKRQRGTLPPAPLEFASQCFLADVLKRFCSKQWRYTHLPFGERRDKVTAIRLHRMGVTPGWPDFMFIGPKASIFFLELKRSGSGRMSEAQLEIAAHFDACEISHLCTDDVTTAIARLTELGILRDRIEVQ